MKDCILAVECSKTDAPLQKRFYGTSNRVMVLIRFYHQIKPAYLKKLQKATYDRRQCTYYLIVIKHVDSIRGDVIWRVKREP